MARKQQAQPKKRSASTTQPSQPPELKNAWSRSDILTASGIIIAIIGLLLSLTIPEVRQFIGLDHPTPPPKPPVYPHLWKYYAGYQQDIPNNTKTDLALNITWQTPLNSSEGKFEGYVTFPPGGLLRNIPENCNLVGSMTPYNPSSYAHMTFTCTFSDKSTDTFDGDVYPDAHISGIVTKSADAHFKAYWHFDVTKQIPMLTGPIPNGLVPNFGGLPGGLLPSTPTPTIGLP